MRVAATGRQHLTGSWEVKLAKGRKRKMGKRTASGQLSRSKTERAKRGQQDVRAVALKQPHRAWLGETRRADQRAESEIGRLCLAGRLTEAEYWAGERWRQLVHDFHRVMATPMTTCSALARMVAEQVGKEDVAGEVGAAERPESEEERRERVLDHHRKAMSTIRRLGDMARPAFTVMENAVLHDRGVETAADLDALRAGLSQLARLWHLTDPTEERPIRSHRGDKATWDHEEKEINIILR